MGKFCYSLDNEHFDSEPTSTIEESIKNGENDAFVSKKKAYWVGEIEEVTLGEIVDAESVLDQSQCLLAELVGDYADDWRGGVSEEVEGKLKDILIKFFQENRLEPSCYKVVNVKMYNV